MQLIDHLNIFFPKNHHLNYKSIEKRVIYIKYCFLRTKRNEPTAGVKAPDDVATICASLGYEIIHWSTIPDWNNNLLIKLWVWIYSNFKWMSLFFKLKDEDVILYQHPSYGYVVSLIWVSIIKAFKNVKTIALIHDLESLRRGIKGGVAFRRNRSNFGDLLFLKLFDKVICHNNSMKSYLIDNGFQETKLVELKMFDYLVPNWKDRDYILKTPINSICIAGNLSSGKSGYIYELAEKNPDLNINLYGINFVESTMSNINYFGSFNPDELPFHLKGHFGLVWDGFSIDSCLGNTGEYLKYNNPHKTSLYLASGIPVIVWSKAAIADFIVKNKVGIVVDSLKDLHDKLNYIDEAMYLELLKNAIQLSNSIRQGLYLKQALSQ